MIAVAVAALCCLFGVRRWRAGVAYEEIYGPDGYLSRKVEYQAAILEGMTAYFEGRFEDSERRYRDARALSSRVYRVMTSYDHVGYDSNVSLGLAEALAAMGRFPEADALFAKAIEEGSVEFGPAHPFLMGDLPVRRAEAIWKGMQATDNVGARPAPPHSSR
ncbi:hypothetical protein [Paludisphaera mucosa]|uniref:Tetratricopeptide repeat protein n=1 Tax=Paludisphaera mucosa TaxID=3030827 RepID=A0ABT6FAG3_9BACT|nr:hypothetical protein [Paludisphaera mucosa]MDG3004569.1 hypothetical protein [Paludisphaera mucosa]